MLLARANALIPCDALSLLRLDAGILTPVAVSGLNVDVLGRRFQPAAHPRHAVRTRAAVSAEQFIELAASRSSQTGNSYLVRCPGAPDVEAAGWLLRQLAELRGEARR